MFRIRLPRLISVSAMVALGVGAIGLTYPGGVSAALSDIFLYPAHQEQLAIAEQADKQLDDLHRRIVNRIAVKDGIIADLLAHRVRFRDATRQFLYLNQNDTRLMAFLREAYAGHSDEERTARNVIDFLRQRVGRTEQSRIVLGQFESEFEAIYGCPVSSR